MTTKPLTDVLASITTAPSPLGLYPLCVTGSGLLQKAPWMLPTPQCPSCNDADEALPGFMKVGLNAKNLPVSCYGSFIFTMNFDDDAKTQLLPTFLSTVQLWARIHSSGVWRPWVKLA